MVAPSAACGALPAMLAASTTARNITIASIWLFAARSDRKSTRLNSSHVRISYAVFCLKKKKGEPWARLGVNVDDNFQALYVVHNDKKQQVSKLKSLLKDADELLLATDEDREGEAIAWHLLEELKPKVPHRRMVFHEITPEAIARAIANPQELNQGKVDAYQARRVLDRLYGYEVSPVLWKKVMPKLSAGRVQSAATRLVVDREPERIAFRPAAYSDIEAEFATKDHGKPDISDPTSFTANLVSLDGRRVAQGRDFTSVGELKSQDLLHL